MKRNIKSCIFFKPRGKSTHYCTIDEKEPLKRCYRVCKDYKDEKQT